MLLLPQQAVGITPDSILNKQSKEGYWPGFPKTSNLTNFIVIDSIKKYECKEALEKIKEWTLNHKAKDGIGWGLNDDDKDSQVSFTVNALLTLLASMTTLPSLGPGGIYISISFKPLSVS